MIDHHPDHKPTVCVLTPHGRGAIAVVSVDGPDAANVVAPLFVAASGKRLAEIPQGRVAFGRWSVAGREEVVVTRFAGRVEIHCHGGIAASRALVESLVEVGCQRVDPVSWLITSGHDPLAAAASELLGRAPTEKAALVLLDQWSGALRTEIERIIALLDSELWDEVQQAIQTLSDRWPLGKRLTQPARVVLTGPPNVGKSSLINALVGYERAIVFDLPGTTRDVVTATTAIDGWAVELIDTAGLRLQATGVEQAGIELAQRALARADLVLRVADAQNHLAGREPATVFDDWVEGKPMIQVINKVDLLATDQREQLSQQADDSLVATSATTGEGVETLLERIADVVVPQEPPAGAAVPVTESQHGSLTTALGFLVKLDSAKTQETLLAMLG